MPGTTSYGESYRCQHDADTERSSPMMLFFHWAALVLF